MQRLHAALWLVVGMSGQSALAQQAAPSAGPPSSEACATGMRAGRDAVPHDGSCSSRCLTSYYDCAIARGCDEVNIKSCADELQACNKVCADAAGAAAAAAAAAPASTDAAAPTAAATAAPSPSRGNVGAEFGVMGPLSNFAEVADLGLYFGGGISLRMLSRLSLAIDGELSIFLPGDSDSAEHRPTDVTLGALLGPRLYVLQLDEPGGLFIEGSVGPSLEMLAFGGGVILQDFSVATRFGLGFEFPSADGTGFRIAGWFFSHRAGDFGRIHALMLSGRFSFGAFE